MMLVKMAVKESSFGGYFQMANAWITIEIPHPIVYWDKDYPNICEDT